MRILLASALACLSAVGLSSAADAMNSKLSTRTSFDIPAQPLGLSLKQLAEQAGVQILFEERVVAGLTARPVKAEISASEALQELLDNTGLEFTSKDETIAVRRKNSGHSFNRRTSTSSAAADALNEGILRFAQRDGASDSPVYNLSGDEGADSGGSGGKDTADAVRLEEIVVTAQKRTESIQEVPISAQVLGAQTLAQQNINSLVDIEKIAPSVHIGVMGRSNEMYIRGVGSGSNQSFDQSVGLFIDDIYHGRSRTTASTFLDLERVEILKGPQSTYFGNNAIAGAFSIVTRKPGRDFDAYVRALYGEAGQYALEGAVGGPLSETFAARFAGIAAGMDGYVKNVHTGKDQPNQDNLAGRLTFLYTPSDALDVALKVEAGKSDDKSGQFYQIDSCPPPEPFVTTGFCATALQMGVPIGFDKYESSAIPGRLKLDTFESVLTADFRRWDHTFTSVSGYYEYQLVNDLDISPLPADLINAQAPEDYRQFSQEFRFVSPTGQRLEYLGGIYFQKDDLFFATRQSVFFLTPALSSIPPLAPLAPYLPLGQDVNLDQRSETYSIFGSATWHATDRLSFTAGLRGTRVDKDYRWNLYYATATQSFGGFVPLPPLQNALAGAVLGAPGTLQGSRSDEDWMPSANVQFKLTPAAMVYASYASGFKAGGFNGTDTSGDRDRLPYGPESVDAYEAGLKSQWLEDRLLLNLAVFRGDYNDLQVSQNIDSASGARISVVRNAAESVSQGVELETKWAVSRDFDLSANVTYLDAYYVKYEDVEASTLQSYCGANPALPYCAARYPNGVAEVQDLSGQRTPRSPQWSGSVKAAYDFQLPANLQLTTEIGAYFTSDWYQDLFDEWAGAYTRWDGRLTLQPLNGPWSVDLIGQNLTDKALYAFGPGGMAISPGSLIARRAQPRNFALQFRYHW